MEVAKSNRYVDNAGYESKIINAALGGGDAIDFYQIFFEGQPRRDHQCVRRLVVAKNFFPDIAHGLQVFPIRQIGRYLYEIGQIHAGAFQDLFDVGIGLANLRFEIRQYVAVGATAANLSGHIKKFRAGFDFGSMAIRINGG